MYSDEDRIKAVQAYIQNSKRLTYTCHTLGYPSQKQLKRWYRGYQENGQQLKRSKKRKSRYSDQQIQDAVNHYLHRGRCLARTIRSLGYPSADLLRR